MQHNLHYLLNMINLKKNNKHQKFLIELPKIVQKTEFFHTIFSPKEFYKKLLNIIYQAYTHIYLTVLYLENDQGGEKIFNALYQIKKIRPQIKIKILVDWNRANRNRFGDSTNHTNIDWYKTITKQHPDTEIPIYGIPININEILGVLHLKGFIIDDQILYSGANINNEYLHINKKYRYDRYHIIRNKKLSEVMIKYIDQELLSSKAIKVLGCNHTYKNSNKNSVRLFRKKLKYAKYYHQNDASFNECSISPLVGLGKNSTLNQTIYHLINSVKKK